MLKLVVVNGLLAFGQNLSSFHTNKFAGALTIANCANFKQLCTIVLATRIFDTTVTLIGVLGVLIALSGTTYYSCTVIREKSEEQQRIESVNSPSRNASLEEKGVKH